MAKKKSISYLVSNQKVKEMLDKYAISEGFKNAGALSKKGLIDYLKRHRAKDVLLKLENARRED